MIKKYILCRGSKTKQEYSDNILKITRYNNVDTIYINSGPENLLNIDTNLLTASGNLIISNNELTTSGTQIDFTGIFDASSPPPGMLDDANVPVPMGGMTFNFFGTSVTNMYWNSNCAITFSEMTPSIVSISRNTIPAILLGNYDRILRKLSYINTTNSDFSITTLYPHFYNYYTDNISTASFYTWRVRIIKENINSRRQFIEVCVGPASIPTPGYSSAIRTYPSGSVDSNGLTIDQTKNSPFNITNGTSFLNLCGSTFGVTSPPANTSFVFSSDSTGTNWVFNNNMFVNL
jgi:hypothetical protein